MQQLCGGDLSRINSICTDTENTMRSVHDLLGKFPELSHIMHIFIDKIRFRHTPDKMHEAAGKDVINRMTDLKGHHPALNGSTIQQRDFCGFLPILNLTTLRPKSSSI
ncbi:hypothetical protein BGZ61DRAFT_468145 [Ilyonectria robusta]|uniref:uncharacterized protein n=1 Tax=Ilyonectria robusta TaxID=1079257 RepID=UPI001E8CA724|nr:uncharacterized protein BGZ61DRAFT_468145 [Ilyonectria robusta]KAH8653297.1 hypothetical protein BGZ61DRAFT_468145 [Ilyonectria robusta]